MADIIEYIIKLKDEISGTLNHITGKTEGMNREMKESSEIVGELRNQFLQFFAIEQIGEFANESLHAFGSYNTAMKELEQTLKNTKGVSGETMESLKALNDQLFYHTEFTREDIAQTEKILLANTHLSKQIYDQAIPAIADLAAYMKTDMAEGAKFLGRALNDPTNGIQRLRQQVPGLTMAMIQHVKKTQFYHGMLAAQKELLNDVSFATKGAAEIALNNDPWGLIAKHVEELKVEFGELLSKGLKKIEPYIIRFVDYVKTDVIPILKEWAIFAKDLFKTLWQWRDLLIPIMELVGGYIAVTKALALFKEAQLAVNLVVEANPYIAAGVAIALIVKNIYDVITANDKLNASIEASKDTYANSMFGLAGTSAVNDAKAAMKADKKLKARDAIIAALIKQDQLYYRKSKNATDQDARDANNDVFFRLEHALHGQDNNWLNSLTSQLGGKKDKNGNVNVDNSAVNSQVKESKAIHINITIGDLVKTLNINAATLTESKERIEQIVTELLLNVVNNGQQIAAR